MATVSWPSGLPDKLLRDGYQEQPPELTVRSGMDEGPDKIRRWGTGNIRPIKGQQLMTSGQVDTLDNFYINTTKGGALRFDWTDPRTYGDSPVTTVEMRFVERPRYQNIGGDTWRVQLNLEIMP